MQECLLRFTRDNPCWTEAMFRQVEPEISLDFMASEGFLKKSEGIYSLTDLGAAKFVELAKECFFEAPSGCVLGHDGEAMRRFLATTRLWLALERGNKQLGGIKNYKFHLDIGADLLFLCYYDFKYYSELRHPNDELGLINADRFFFSLENGIEKCAELVSSYHAWLNELRHELIPGLLDLDSLQQDSVNWLVFVRDTEAEALRLRDELAALGSAAMIAPAAPMEIWTLSLERLENFPPKQDVIWELLPQTANPVFR